MGKTLSLLERHDFLLRRLHSLTGVVPIGVFLIMHLTTNSSVVWGALNARADSSAVATPIDRGVATFTHEVHFINNLPLLLLMEIFVLWLPIAFHSIFGLYIATTGKSNTTHYAYKDNWRYTLQRISGYVGLLFIFYHVATLRWGWTFLVPGGTQWSHYYASSTLAAALRGDPTGQWTILGVLVSLFYLLGVSMLVYHLANGLWTAAITWGITISERAQRQWGIACAALGIALMGAGWSAVAGFAFLVDVDRARVIEERIVLEKYGESYLNEIRIKYANHPREQLEQAIRTAANAPYPGPAPTIEQAPQ